MPGAGGGDCGIVQQQGIPEGTIEVGTNQWSSGAIGEEGAGSTICGLHTLL
jgi:hypothetical protein